jgi:hypothetical protein
MVTKSAEDLSLQSPQEKSIGMLVRNQNRLSGSVIQIEIIMHRRTFEAGKIRIPKLFVEHEGFRIRKQIVKTHSHQAVDLNGRLTDIRSGNQKVCRKLKNLNYQNGEQLNFRL